MQFWSATLCLALGFVCSKANASELGDLERPAVTASQLKRELAAGKYGESAAPLFFMVVAFVVSKEDKCAKCPPYAVCETCILGISVADDPTQTIPSNDSIFVLTDIARKFKVGKLYRFKLAYQMEKNAAGLWITHGPTLVEYTLLDTSD